jgi:D-alanine-D-alanine ligase
MRIAFTHNLQTEHDEEQAEFDREETVAAIAAGLRACGHDVARVNVGGAKAGDLVRRLEELAPDLIFNTAEGTHGRFREAFYPGLFEQLGIPFTGSDAYVCALTLDKQLTKMLVSHHGVPTPKWIFVEDEDWDKAAAAQLTFPVIVKPNYEGSSKGITLDSVVEDPRDLEARVASILAKYPSGLLIEEFIVGRDIVVPFLERSSPSTAGVLTPVAYKFDENIIGKRKYAIYDYELKCVSSEAVEVECPAPVDDVVRRRLIELSGKAFKALGVRDLGRIDWRLTDDGRVYFLEVNALPSLEPGAGIYLASALAGLDTTESVLGAVVDSAAERWGIAAKKSMFARAKKTRVGLTFNLKRKVPQHAHDDDSEAEYDSVHTIDALARAIASHGHQVVRLEATADIVRTLPDAKVDVVFNLAEGLRGRSREAHVPALLEMLGVPFSGSDAATMALALDKHLAKAVVGAAGVPVPHGFTMSSGDDLIPLSIVFPVIAKPNTEGSSKGVQPKSVAVDEAQLRAIVSDQVARYQQAVLVEEFLPGREFTVALLGEHDKPRVLPPMEIVFVEPDSAHPVYAFGDKLDWTKKIRYDRPADVDDAMAKQIHDVAIGAWRALNCRDVARFDLRCDKNGNVRFIEVNTLPGITPGWSDLCLIAESAGMTYDALIGEILAPALDRMKRGA